MKRVVVIGSGNVAEILAEAIADGSGYALVQIYARMQKEALRKQITLLDAYSPLAILQRGYALVEQQDTLIKSAQQLQKGDQVHIRFHDGGWRAQLIEKEESHGKEGNV